MTIADHVRWQWFGFKLRFSRWLMPADHYHAQTYWLRANAWERQLREAGLEPVSVPHPDEYAKRLTPREG